MTDMTHWTEEEKISYLNVLRKVSGGGQPSKEELHDLSDNAKNALVDVYMDICYPKPKSIVMRIRAWLR